jgi:predicted ATPase
MTRHVVTGALGGGKTTVLAAIAGGVEDAVLSGVDQRAALEVATAHRLGYEPIEVPRGPLGERAAFIVDRLPPR